MIKKHIIKPLIAFSFIVITIFSTDNGYTVDPTFHKEQLCTTPTRRLSEIIDQANQSISQEDQIASDDETIREIARILRQIGDELNDKIHRNNQEISDINQRKSSSTFPGSSTEDLSDITPDSPINLVHAAVWLFRIRSQDTSAFPKSSRRRCHSTPNSTPTLARKKYDSQRSKSEADTNQSFKSPHLRSVSSAGSDNAFKPISEDDQGATTSPPNN